MNILPVEHYLNSISLIRRIRRQEEFTKAKKKMSSAPNYVIFGFTDTIKIIEFEDLLDQVNENFSGAYFYDQVTAILWLENFEDAVLLRLC